VSRKLCLGAPRIATLAARPPVRPWTEAEDDRLRRAYADGERIDRVAAELGRTTRAASSRAAKQLKLGGTHAAGRGGWATAADWTEAEDARLRAAYGKVPTKTLATELGRSKLGVYQRAWHLGLKHGYHRDWSPDEQSALSIAHERGISISDVATALGRNYYAVCKYAENRGLKFGKRPIRAAPMTLQDILTLADPAAPIPAAHARTRPAKVRQPKDWPEERRSLWLETLERTGSIQEALAAIGLKGSSAAVAYRLKHRDPAFSEAWDAALLRSPYRPGPKPKLAPGEKRAPRRGRSWSDPERQRLFLEALRRSGVVTQALTDMGLNARSHHGELARRRSEDKAFDAASEAVVAARREERQVVRAIADIARRAKRISKPPKPAAVRVRRARPRLSKPSAVAARSPEPTPRPTPAPPRQPTPRPTPPPPEPSAPTLPSAPAPTPAASAAEPPQRGKPGALSVRSGDYAGFRYGGEGDATPWPKRKTDAEIAAEALRYQEERRRIEACGRSGLDIESAKRELQRRGRVVYRASVNGGRPDRWYVGSLGKEVTDQQLIAEAERLMA
jgi:hypothetical protein